jgi:MFS family permease
LLRSIPGDRIFRVQLADAAAEVAGSLYNDLLHYQRLPGEGDFDLPTVIGILDNIGALTRSVSSCFPIGSTTSTLDAIRELLAQLPIGTLAVIYAIGVIVQIVFFMIPVDIPFYLESVTPVGETLTGLAIAAATLTGAIVASRYQQIKARLGVVGVLAVMFGFMGVGLFVVSLGNTYAVIVAGTAITGLGVGLQQPNLTSWIGNAVPDDARGRALGGLTSSFFVGQFLSPVITEPTSEIVGGLGPTFSIGGLVFLVLAVVAIAVQFGIRPRIAGAREEQT